MAVRVVSDDYPSDIAAITPSYSVTVTSNCDPTSSLTAPTSLSDPLVFEIGTTASPVTHDIPAWT